tara:strand:+ start:5608 stop:6726 length:1119 start_codon:yes stop_codon:yes gene_type:complete
MICAEESSAAYGKKILTHLNEMGNFDVFGIGSKPMEELGMRRQGKSEEMAIMGILEVVKHYSKFKKIFQQILAEVDRSKCQTALLVDYPGFNLRLAKELKKRGVKIVYFVSPSVWAWKKYRIKTIKECVQEMLVIFPFEEDFYRQEGVKAEYVGNPLMEDFSKELLDPEAMAEKKSRMGLSPNDEVMGLMPGSRASEIEQHLQIQIDTYRALKRKKPHLKANLLLAENISRESILPLIDNDIEDFSIIKDRPFSMLQSVDHVLVASGTATLVVGLMQKPMLIMYRVNPVSAWIAKKLVHVKWVGIINLIFQRELVPERIQQQVNVKELEKTYLKIIEPNEQERIRKELAALPEILGHHDTCANVAKRLVKYV